jgi:hypothetical protein
MTLTLGQSAFHIANEADRTMKRQQAVREHDRLLGNLREAEQQFATEVRANCSGTAGEYGLMLIESDLMRLTEVGTAIGRVARLLGEKIDACQYVSAVVATVPAAVRMVESLDDSIPAFAWAVINAAAELEASL